MDLEAAFFETPVARGAVFDDVTEIVVKMRVVHLQGLENVLLGKRL